MTSFSETTSVSIRKGTTDENLSFVGVLGEVTADLGFPDEHGDLGLDNNATLRLHNGVTPGGIPVMRADARNMTSQVLATNRDSFGDKNLAYADLSNIEKTDSQVAKEKIVSTLVSYSLVKQADLDETLTHYAKTDMSNINTSVLATGEGQEGKHGGKNLAYADMSNVDTTVLGTPSGHAGFNLAYTNMSNVDTSYLATGEGQEGKHSGKDLAYADMSNVTGEALETMGLVELTERKDFAIDIDEIVSNHYPTTQAVVDYTQRVVTDTLADSDFMKADISNATSYDPLYSTDYRRNTFYNSNDYIHIPTGQGFVAPEYDPETGLLIRDSVYYTGILLYTDEGGSYYQYDTESLQLVVNELTPTHKLSTEGCSLNINKGGNYLLASLKTDEAPETITEPTTDTFYVYSDKGEVATINITSIYNPNTKLYSYTLDRVLSSSRSFQEGMQYLIYKNRVESIEGQSGYEEEAELVKVILPLYLRPTEVTEDGRIVTYEYVPAYTSVDITKQTFTITSNTAGEAVFDLDYKNTFPNIGGAGLLKTDLSNLPGMSDTDKVETRDIPWRINPNVRVPSQKIRSISPASYYTIATIGSVWKAIYDVNGGEDPWDTSDCVHLEGDETIEGVKTFTQPIIGVGLVTLNGDLAEKYKADKKYAKGTLVQFGGTAEITEAKTEVNAVISADPGVLLNKNDKGQPIVLTGKTPIRIKGVIHKFDKIVLSEEAGIGRVKKWNDFRKPIIAIALEDNIKEEEKLVMCVTKLTL